VTAPRPWLGISDRDWFIKSDTPQSASTSPTVRGSVMASSGRTTRPDTATSRRQAAHYGTHAVTVCRRPEPIRRHQPPGACLARAGAEPGWIFCLISSTMRLVPDLPPPEAAPADLRAVAAALHDAVEVRDAEVAAAAPEAARAQIAVLAERLSRRYGGAGQGAFTSSKPPSSDRPVCEEDPGPVAAADLGSSSPARQAAGRVIVRR